MQVEEIMQLEKWLEEGFKKALFNLVPDGHVYLSRDLNVNQTPRLTMKVHVDQAALHQYTLPDAIRWIDDGWQGSISVEIATNRSNEDPYAVHHKLLGAVRYRMSMLYLVPIWTSICKPLILTGIHSQPGEDAFVDNDDVDTSKLNYLLIFNVNPTIWPSVIS